MTHPVKLISTITLLAGDHVILVRYKEMPDHQRGWFLPHVLLEEFEHPTEGIKRGVQDQLGLEIHTPQLKDLESFKGRDGTWHMSFHHLMQLPQRVEPKPGRSIADVEWFALNRLPPRSEVAHHGWAIDTIAAVRAKN